MKTALSTIAALLLSPYIYAQIGITNTIQHTSIQLGEHVDNNKIIEYFGAYQDIESHDDEAFGGKTTTYTYSKAWFMTIDGILTCFGICDSRYELFIPNTCKVRVGDRLSDFLAKLPKDKIRQYLEDNMLKIYLYYDEALIIETDSEGIIKCLCWHVPV